MKPQARPDGKELRKQAEKSRILRLSLSSMAKRANRLAQKLAAAEQLIGKHAAKVVFGGSKLIRQRGQIGQPGSPFPMADDWCRERIRKRDGHFLFDGAAHAPQKNRHAKYEGGKLRIRLTEALARERLREISANTAIPFEELSDLSKHKHSKRRTASEWLNLDCAFKGQEANLAQLNSFLQKESGLPVSWRLSIEPIKKDRDWPKNGYPESGLGLQVVARAQAMDDAEPQIWASDKANGCIGVDANAFGISFCLCKPDGNFAGSKGKIRIAERNCRKLRRAS